MPTSEGVLRISAPLLFPTMSDPVFAFVGNPNCGKTTLFNALTGLRQKVGNYPGVTVEKKTGRMTLDGATFDVIDLPGTYSLAPRSLDEMVAVLEADRPQAKLLAVNEHARALGVLPGMRFAAARSLAKVASMRFMSGPAPRDARRRVARLPSPAGRRGTARAVDSQAHRREGSHSGRQ